MSRKSQFSHRVKSQNARKNQSATQKTLEETFTNLQKENSENIDENIQKLVRYVVYKAGNNLPVKKLDIQKNVLQNVGKSYETVLKEANKVLKNVYGYELHLCEQPASNKQYIVKNTLPFVDLNVEEKEVPDDAKKILILLVLSHVFMSNNYVGEASLFSFLQSLKIDPYERHEIFGNVKEFVTSEMVRQRYLAVETDHSTRKNNYLWGTKAEVEISKRKILEFVCKIYKDRKPNSWNKQYEMAMEQAIDDNEIRQNGTTEEGNSSQVE